MIGERLQKLYVELEKKNVIQNKKDFAKILGVDYGSLSKYLSDKVNLSINNLNYQSIKNASVSIDWLLTGEGEMFVGEKKTLTPCEARIPIINQKVSCGPGQELVPEESIIEYVDIRSLSPKLTAKNVYGFRAVGTSMIGAGIHEGDIVLFNASPDQTLVDGIYVFGLDGEAYCKRLEFDPLTSIIKIYSVRVADLEKAELLLTLKSTDSGYADRFKLFGRVFSWVHLMND